MEGAPSNSVLPTIQRPEQRTEACRDRPPVEYGGVHRVEDEEPCPLRQSGAVPMGVSETPAVSLGCRIGDFPVAPGHGLLPGFIPSHLVRAVCLCALDGFLERQDLFRRVQAGDLDSRVSGKLDPHDLER